MVSTITQIFLAVVLTSVLIKGDKNETVPSSVNMMLVRTLQNQLKTCMDQYADLVRRSCSSTDGTKDLEENVSDRDVAFHAGLSKYIQNLPHNYEVIFDRVYLNEGKGYDNHTGIFTCPIDGIYAFDWTILTKAGKYFYTDFNVNGNIVGRSHANAATVNRAASSMVVQKLMKGDKAWIEPHASYTGQNADAEWCFFSGFKI